MGEAEASLEGWMPEPTDDLPLERIIDLAFDYRGNTTVVKRDGSEVEGYIFNRNAEAAEPFIQLFDTSGAGPLRIPYSEIRMIKFTGKDTAAGQSYAAWVTRKEREKSERAAAGSAPPP
jgi:hypothetical protein